MANQPMFKRTGYNDLGPRYGPFSKGMQTVHDFRACFGEVYIHGVFWPDTFVVG